MAKRSNDDSDGEEYVHEETTGDVLKRRKISFEPVRLLAVHNVNDMRTKVSKYQATKLKQAIAYKNHKINELESENERLKRRQETDENNFYRLHRQGMQLETQIMRFARTEFDMDMNWSEEDVHIKASEISELDQEKFEQRCEKQKDRLKSVLNQLSIHKQKRADHVKKYSKQISAFCEEHGQDGNHSVYKELSEKVSTLASENSKLVAENLRLQVELNNTTDENKEKTDIVDLFTARADEMKRELEDVKFEADKNLRLANKLEVRLCNIVSEMKGNAMNEESTGVKEQKVVHKVTNGGTTNVAHSPGSDTSTKEKLQNDSLRNERDDLNELAIRRLQELNDANKKISNLSVEIEKLKCNSLIVSSDAIVNSEEYLNLKRYYSLAMAECEKMGKELETAIMERDKLRTHWEKTFQQYEETLKAARKEYEIVEKRMAIEIDELKFSTDILKQEIDSNSYEATRSLQQNEIEELQSANTMLKTKLTASQKEVNYTRQKLDDNRNQLNRALDQYHELRKQFDNTIIVPLDGEIQRTEEKDCSKLVRMVDGLKAEIKRLATDENRKAYIESLVHKEVKRRVRDTVFDYDVLQKQLQANIAGEKGMAEEMDNIGAAMEELQQKVTMMEKTNKDREESEIGNRNERMITAQVMERLRGQLTMMREKQAIDETRYALYDEEKKTAKDLRARQFDQLDLKTKEIQRLTLINDTLRRNMQEMGMVRDDLMIRCDKAENSLKSVKDSLNSKASQLETVCHKKNRSDEELNSLRKKYERIQKSEKFGSTDAVLNEEIRQLKETLTCPSCKTKQKDCIMLKCYHLFCESCIRTRYDTRQRKCPKCNSGFGANDFHRIFL